MSRRTSYPNERKYKNDQMKFLINIIENNLGELEYNYRKKCFSFEEEHQKLLTIKEMFAEIALRLD